MMAKPPGVRVMASAIQNPPYEDKAVAPKVFPTAISLETTRFSNNKYLLLNLRIPLKYFFACMPKKKQTGQKIYIFGRGMERKGLFKNK